VSAYKIHIKGLVQGVGFRPFVYRLARQNDLKGWVVNRNDGVVIKLMTGEQEVSDFAGQIRRYAPAASRIRLIDWQMSEEEELDGFHIITSRNASQDATDISPDIAVCPHCLEDMRRQPHRINYPFVNCTHCGPRFSIIKGLPYDRARTTMSDFTMCSICHEEYHDVNDRRFHAQPVACNHCGPHYEYYQQGRVMHDINRVLTQVTHGLGKGWIIAVKGIGGFHLMCDASNEKAVARLRRIKRRETRPFACMFSDLETLRQYAHVNQLEEQHLTGWRRPIVLLEQKQALAPSLNLQVNTIGAMLPYMPLHELIFAGLNLPALVMTSANLSNEPLIADNQTAHHKLSRQADALLLHNRAIANRVDDSVVRIIDGQIQPLRRSRGYVPEPLPLNFTVNGILATGAELKNCFCIGKGDQAIMSQHIGDLKNYETYDFYTHAVDRLLSLFRVTPHCVVSDLHPDYFSTRYARNYAKQKTRMGEAGDNHQVQHIQVQHHHAHIASCMAEHHLRETVIGVALDGTGFGPDGHIWGGEFLTANLTSFHRYTHLTYVPMPGGDKAVHQPWRMALSYLYQSFGPEFSSLPLDMLSHHSREDLRLMSSMIRKRINSPLTSSTGRVFDAVSALLNVCTHNRFEGEAAMRLEALVDPHTEGHYSFGQTPEGIDLTPAFREMVTELLNGHESSLIATRFHHTIARIITSVAEKIRQEAGYNKVVLSGGTFQNKYLSETTAQWLRNHQFEVYAHRRVPANDGGIALGQMVVAANK